MLPLPPLPPSVQLRALLDQERFSSVVQLRKRKDHFIFTIESTGVKPPEQLLMQVRQHPPRPDPT